MKRENPVLDEIPFWLTFLTGSATGYVIDSKIGKIAAFGLTTGLIYTGVRDRRFSSVIFFGIGEILGTLAQILGKTKSKIIQFIVIGEDIYMRENPENEEDYLTGREKIKFEAMDDIFEEDHKNAIKEGKLEVQIIVENKSIVTSMWEKIGNWIVKFREMTGKNVILKHI